MKTFALPLVAVLLQSPAATAQQSTATVEGIVVQSGTGQPLAGAKVQLFRASQRGAGGGPVPAREGGMPGGGRLSPEDLAELAPRSATTTQDGRFRFETVKPGEYRLLAAKSGGYVPGEFGQRSPRGTGISFELAGGHNFRGVQLVLTPTGSISGRVYDRDGGLGRIQVQALRPVYRDGARSLTIVQSVLSNDRGEYRLFWLPPGDYYVGAKPAIESPLGVRITEPIRGGSFEQASGPVITTRRTATGEAIEETRPATYYPGTTDLATASRIDLRAGGNAEGLDIPLTSDPVRTRHLRGVVTMNGQPVAAAGIIAVPRSLEPHLTIPSARAGADGSFDISGVLPGSYYLHGSTNGGMTGGLAIQVGDADVDNLIVPVAGGFKLTGRFVLEDHAGSVATDISLLRLTISRDPSVVGMPESGPSYTPPPSADGSFVVEGVPSGDFRIGVRALPPDAYIASARMGMVDVLDGGLHLSAAPRAPLEIVIRDAGTLEGTVISSRQEPVANGRVVAVPEPALRHRLDLYKSTVTDRTGRFRLRGLAAGTYTVLAWEDIDEGAWQDSDILRRDDDRGSAIRVRDGATESIQLTAIPVR